MRAWQNRPLDPIYPIVTWMLYTCACVINGHGKNRVVYVANRCESGWNREVLGVWTSANEGAKFWLQVLTEIENRGVQDVLSACVDGLEGFPEAIEELYPRNCASCTW